MLIKIIPNVPFDRLQWAEHNDNFEKRDITKSQQIRRINKNEKFDTLHGMKRNWVNQLDRLQWQTVWVNVQRRELKKVKLPRFKVTMIQKLNEEDSYRCVRLINMYQQNEHFAGNLILSDEATFYFKNLVVK